MQKKKKEKKEKKKKRFCSSFIQNHSVCIQASGIMSQFRDERERCLETEQKLLRSTGSSVSGLKSENAGVVSYSAIM